MSGEVRQVIDECQELLKTLRAVPVVARAIAEPFDDWTMRQRPTDGELAAIEVLGHMADINERGLAQIERMLNEDNPELPSFDHEASVTESGFIDTPTPIAIARLDAALRALVARLAGLDDAGWRRTGRHAEHGPITVEALVAHLVGEDVDHLAQIARLPTVEEDAVDYDEEPEYVGVAELQRDQVLALWWGRVIAAEVAVRPDEALTHARVTLAELRRAHPEAEPTLAAWERVIEKGPETVMQVLSATSPAAVELRATSPFIGLIPDAVRDQVVSAFQAYWRASRS